jgi:hypothetical protein
MSLHNHVAILRIHYWQKIQTWDIELHISVINICLNMKWHRIITNYFIFQYLIHKLTVMMVIFKHHWTAMQPKYWYMDGTSKCKYENKSTLLLQYLKVFRFCIIFKLLCLLRITAGIYGAQLSHILTFRLLLQSKRGGRSSGLLHINQW